MATLPTLAELHEDTAAAFKNDQLNTLLGQPPFEKWIKKHPMYNSKYLPVDKLEFLMNRIFGQWKLEVISCAPLFQSIGVHVRLHYRNPVDGVWYFHDGVGGAPIQVNAGANASDLGAIKNNAVQIALPMAETMAFKDAAAKLGSLFGKDLNRKDVAEFEGFFTGKENKKMEQPHTQEMIRKDVAQYSNNIHNNNFDAEDFLNPQDL